MIHQDVLGVECDGAMYHSSANAKERDVYRQTFLENRGWKIERIWSRNWRENPSAEIERIDIKVKELLKSEEVRESVMKLEKRHDLIGYAIFYYTILVLFYLEKECFFSYN